MRRGGGRARGGRTSGGSPTEDVPGELVTGYPDARGFAGIERQAALR